MSPTSPAVGVPRPSPSPAPRGLHTCTRRCGSSQTGWRSCLSSTKGFHTPLFIEEQSGAGVEHGEKAITGKQGALRVPSQGSCSRSAGTEGTEGWVSAGSSPSAGNRLWILAGRSAPPPLPFPGRQRTLLSSGTCEARLGVRVVLAPPAPCWSRPVVLAALLLHALVKMPNSLQGDPN